MAELTPAQRLIADQMLAGTMSNPAMQTQGWGQPTGNAPRQGTVNTPYLRQGTSGVKFYLGKGFVPGAIPRAQASRPPAWTNNGPALFQIGQELARQPGTRYAVDGTGQRIDPIKLGYGSSSQNPAVTAATQMGQGVAPPFPASVDQRLKARSDALNRAWLEAQAGQPGGIRPGWTMPQVGANPGMGGAMIGNGVMAPGIPPQGPPPAGIAPTVWAGGGAPAARPAAPIMRPAEAYALKNLAGQQAALGRQATATGTAGGWNYVNGQRTGTVGGVSPAAAYDRAAAAARQSSPDNGGNPSWW